MVQNGTEHSVVTWRAILLGSAPSTRLHWRLM
jgi:hypothetical protein